MEKFFKKKSVLRPPTQNNTNNLQADPGLRIPISSHNPNVQDEIRRAYLQKGPCQPSSHNFPYKKFGYQSRLFNPVWLNEFSTWLEYSTANDAAYCLCCYLFKPNVGDQAGGDSFVGEGFSNWKKKERFLIHVGGHSSTHNKARRSCEALMNQGQHIQTLLEKQSDQARIDYRTRLNASINAIRYLLRRGLAFRGNDESEKSINQGNFLELMKYTVNLNEDIKAVALKNAPLNLKLTSPDIQKEIVNSIATEIVDFIIKDLGDALFALLIDESRDVSVKEKMVVVLRYVNKKGHIIERFIGVVHVADTNAISLKKAIDLLFSRLGLSISRLRGQGFDGASNMRGEFNGLKSLILKENEFAFYVHCFAHQLQLALVGVANHHDDIMSVFLLVSNVVNLVGASCKRRDTLREKELAKLTNGIEKGEIKSGQGLNQSVSLQRPGDTRWGSHYCTLLSLLNMFSSVVSVLAIVAADAQKDDQRYQAKLASDSMHTFDFVFGVHLIRNVLGFANELSKALQRKDQDIVNAMDLVKVCKQRLQMMRDDGWNPLLAEVSLFCERNEIDVPNMNDAFFARKRSQRKALKKTNLHHYRVRLFYEVIDMQFQELNNRFNEANTELLLCVACLCPDDDFFAFDKQKLVRLAQFYPEKNFAFQLIELDNQLDTYILDLRSSSCFKELTGIAALAKKMVETKRDKVYILVYLLVTLALILPVATATVERAFSAMNIIKSPLHNRMEDQ